MKTDKNDISIDLLGDESLLEDDEREILKAEKRIYELRESRRLDEQNRQLQKRQNQQNGNLQQNQQNQQNGQNLNISIH